jgi:hypothetical protein
VLHRVENASVTFRYGTFSMGKGYVRLQVGGQIVDFGSVIPKEFRELQVAQQEYPLRLPKIGERRYWQFQDRIYWESEDLDADEVYALLVSKHSVSGRASSVRRQWLPGHATTGPGTAARRDSGRCQTVGLAAGRRPVPALRRSGGAPVRPRHSGHNGRQQQP